MPYPFPISRSDIGYGSKLVDSEMSILSGKNICHFDFSVKPGIVSSVVKGTERLSMRFRECQIDLLIQETNMEIDANKKILKNRNYR